MSRIAKGSGIDRVSVYTSAERGGEGVREGKGVSTSKAWGFFSEYMLVQVCTTLHNNNIYSAELYTYYVRMLLNSV